MKKEYVKPAMESETFITDEYVAACWTVWCNVPWGYGYYEKNGRPGYQEDSEDEFIAGPGSGCGTSHTASGIDADGPSANAMWHVSGTEASKDYEVFHWRIRGNGSSSHHFSKVSDAKWEKNPNASN